MKPLGAWCLVMALAIATASCLAGPLWLALGIAAVGLAVARLPSLAWMGASTLALDTVFFGLLLHDGPPHALGPLTWFDDGAGVGFDLGIRLVAAIAINVAALHRAGVAQILDGLRLPRTLGAYAASSLLALQGLADEAHTLVLARRLDNAWPRWGHGRLRALASFVAPLYLASWRAARMRAEAYRLAGVALPRDFAAVTSVAALAMAGRLAFVGLPNVALTYAVVFVGGALWGGRVGALAGALAMALTNLALTGLLPAPFVNVPAMALVGALGGWLGPALHPAGGSRTAVVLAAVTGFGATLLFSLATDAATWVTVPGIQRAPGSLLVLIEAGLAFNLLPAVANAALFAWAVPPAARALRAAAVPREADAQPSQG